MERRAEARNVVASAFRAWLRSSWLKTWRATPSPGARGASLTARLRGGLGVARATVLCFLITCVLLLCVRVRYHGTHKNGAEPSAHALAHDTLEYTEKKKAQPALIKVASKTNVSLPAPGPELAGPASSCMRQCSTGAFERNTIYLHQDDKRFGDAAQAGLLDRISMLVQMCNLAGYLCARLIVPPPRAWLSPKHNRGHRVHAALQWTDFVELRFKTNASSSCLGPLPKPGLSNSGGTRTKAELQVTTTRVADLRRDFDRVEQASFKSHGKGGIDWHIDVAPFYKWDKSLEAHIVAERAGRPDVPHSMLPQLAPRAKAHGGLCKYVRALNADPVTRLARAVRTAIVHEERKTTPHAARPRVRGKYHIRRGDAVRECDTSVQRIAKFIECSFGNLSLVDEMDITLLFHSDERDAKYRQAIRKLFERTLIRDNSKLRTETFIDLDHLVERTLKVDRGSGIKFMNNYHIFLIIGALSEHVDFEIEHRRKYNCRDCVPELAQRIRDAARRRSATISDDW
ncbi:hypothetical protein FVE85_4356 [Porphyridium purpureum]|uniref:Uncharacterized protein n=1 Tax=Porphyridium purpureum TaxID=35688 RepID=A0A5J4YHU9_PORPP|nr:hypothetical protein FVE85_4356 [Porphyridium purpureum]|eukprot:POR9214..scf270_19